MTLNELASERADLLRQLIKNNIHRNEIFAAEAEYWLSCINRVPGSAKGLEKVKGEAQRAIEFNQVTLNHQTIMDALDQNAYDYKLAVSRY